MNIIVIGVSEYIRYPYFSSKRTDLNNACFVFLTAKSQYIYGIAPGRHAAVDEVGGLSRISADASAAMPCRTEHTNMGGSPKQKCTGGKK